MSQPPDPRSEARSSRAEAPAAARFLAELALELLAGEPPWDDDAVSAAARAAGAAAPEAVARLDLDESDLPDDLQRNETLLVAHGLRRRRWDFLAPELGRAFALAALRARGGAFAPWLERAEKLTPAAAELLRAWAEGSDEKQIEAQLADLSRTRPDLHEAVRSHLSPAR